MKYNSTHPNTDPEAAISAYKVIRAGCWMESSISRRSLITGNVRTDESKNEIKNSPGAPSVPANTTIFCFQTLSFPCKTPPRSFVGAQHAAPHPGKIYHPSLENCLRRFGNHIP